MSVANARCDGSIEFTSQKNKQVSIAAPGMAILSSVPREYGFVRGHITTTAQVTTGAKTRSVGYLANGFLVSSAGTLALTSSRSVGSCSRQHVSGSSSSSSMSVPATSRPVLFRRPVHLQVLVTEVAARCVTSDNACTYTTSWPKSVNHCSIVHGKSDDLTVGNAGFQGCVGYYHMSLSW